MGNTFRNRSDAQISNALALVLDKGAGGAAPYDLDPSLLLAARAAQDAIDAAIVETAVAAAAAKAAYRNKDDRKATGVNVLNAVATALYGLGLSASDLTAIGIAPKSAVHSRPAAASAVARLLAVPVADGTVRLSWDRGANPKSATFVVETSADGQDWTYLRTTPRVTFLAAGFAPGVAAWFRVTATTATTASLPSSPASIYPAWRAELKLAA